MRPWTFALYLTCLFLGKMSHSTALELSSSLHLISVDVGESVTLQCSQAEEDFWRQFYWYKQTLGQKPRLISKFSMNEGDGIFYNDFKNNSRFALDTKNGKYHLTISNLHASDSATYYCIRSYMYDFQFVESTFIAIKHLDSQTLIHQPASVTIQPGDSVTLNCTIHTRTCDGEHSVYWFRSSDESHLAIIYSNGVRNDQCERKPKVQTQTCVYNFEVDVSDAGTYYCAVASCGEILFGNGTNVDIEHEGDPLVLVCFLSGALAFTIILICILAFSLYKMKKGISCQCTAPSMSNPEGHQDADLHYAAVRVTRGNRPRQQRDNTKNECVYSSVRQ